MVTRRQPSTPDEPLFNQSLDKGLGVLCAFNPRRRTMSLAEVAQATDMTKSSAQRMVYTLERLGYLRKHPRTRRYELTPKVMQVGFNYLACNSLVEIATPFLSELSRVTAETCNLTEPDGVEMVYVARFVSAKWVPIHMPIGSRIPMYCTASGRAYLSALPDAEATALLERSPRQAHTPCTITDIATLRERLALARRQGYATNSEELYRGDMAIAAAVFGPQERPLGAVHVVAPTSRWTLDDARSRLAPAILECARAISHSTRALN